MVHSTCTSESDGTIPYFRHLWRTLLAPNIDPRIRLRQLFERETAEFDLEFGFLSYIDLETETERFDVVYGSHERLKPNTTVPLSQTYCRETIADPSGTVAISDAPAEGWDDDPAYETFGLGSYLGTTVSVDGELYGTLCFAGTAARDDPLVDAEKALLEMHARWVAYTLSHWGEPPARETCVETVAERAVASEAVDSMMDALRSRTRRMVLIALLGDAAETGIATLTRKMNHGNARMQLYHNHLPKLADAGYIEWGSDTDTVSRGPNFAEIEPLVQLLRAYDTTFLG